MDCNNGLLLEESASELMDIPSSVNIMLPALGTELGQNTRRHHRHSREVQAPNATHAGIYITLLSNVTVYIRKRMRGSVSLPLARVQMQFFSAHDGPFNVPAAIDDVATVLGGQSQQPEDIR